METVGSQIGTGYNSRLYKSRYEPLHGISNNVVSGTSKASDQPARMRTLIRALLAV